LLWIRILTNPVQVERHVVDETACRCLHYTLHPVFSFSKLLTCYAWRLYVLYIYIYSWPVIILLFVFGFQARPLHWLRFDLAFMSLSGATHACYLAARYVIFVCDTIESVVLASFLVANKALFCLVSESFSLTPITLMLWQMHGVINVD
jgi:hypothetical protein